MRRCVVAKFVAAPAEKTLQVPPSLLTEARDHPDKVAKVVIRQLPNEVCEPTGPEGWRLITLVERTKELTLGQQGVDRRGRCSTSFESGPTRSVADSDRSTGRGLARARESYPPQHAMLWSTNAVGSWRGTLLGAPI